MLQNLVFVVCVFHSQCLGLEAVVFVQKPQNRTIFNSEPFFFNCSTDVASNDGMDWQVRIGGIYERICSSKDFKEAGPNNCQLNYSMEVPNNRTLNLIVDPRIAKLGDEYCCQFDNGAGQKSCSYLTDSRPTVPAFADITTAVATQKITTATEEPPASGVNITGLIVGIVVGIVVATIIIALVVWIWRKHRNNAEAPGTDTNLPLNPSQENRS